MESLPDGRVALRFTRHLAQPCELVWRALTEREHLRAWFVDILDYDRSQLDFAPGADLTFVAGDLPTGRGRVTAHDPPELLEYTWDAEVLRFELTRDGDGCLLTFTNIVDGPETAAAVATGWDAGLDRLATYLGGLDARG